MYIIQQRILLICGTISPGLHEVQVNSTEEAMLVLRLGIKHRHVASTKLNYQSSRSHSIYTIKLVRLANLDKPTNALINR